MTHITGTFYSIKLQKMVDLEDIQVESFPDSFVYLKERMHCIWAINSEMKGVWEKCELGY